MSKWLLRGLVFAAFVVVLRLIQGYLVDTSPTTAYYTSPGLGMMLTVPVIIWAFLDGRADAKAEPDPDRRADLAMIWLLAGIVAGVVGDLVTWAIALVYQPVYTGGLLAEAVTYASFTALLVFIVGMAAITIGRWTVDRKAGPWERRRTEADKPTDVFSAVSGVAFRSGSGKG